MEWQRTKQAAESLSLISCDQLRKFVREGFFKEGIDYRDIRLRNANLITCNSDVTWNGALRCR